MSAFTMYGLLVPPAGSRSRSCESSKGERCYFEDGNPTPPAFLDGGINHDVPEQLHQDLLSPHHYRAPSAYTWTFTRGERIHVLAWNKRTGQSRFNPHARKCKGNDGGSEAGDPRTPRASKRLTCANERNESHLPRLCWTAND